MTWRELTLGELVRFRRGHDLPESARKSGPVPVVGSAGQNGWHNEARAEAPGVSIGRSGASIGKVTYTPVDYWPHNACLYVTDFFDNDPRFVYYFLQTKDLTTLNSGAAQPSLNRNFVHTVPVRVPGPNEQVAIASILSAYDDLIENNRRRIALLVEAARLLYREWFVRFRFPGHERVKVTDHLPEGWGRVRMKQVLTALESGGRPRGGALESDGIPSIGAENVIDLGQYDYSKKKYVPEDFFQKMQRGVIQNRDVVLYKDGAHIGRSSMFGDGFPHLHCAVNEHVFILRAQEDVGQNYLYFWLSQPETRRSVVNLNANTAQPGISQNKLKTLWFLRPPGSLMRLFNHSVEAQVAQILRLALMNRRLAEARDLLLPRLMNGEIAV